MRIALLAVLLLAGCATPSTNPSYGGTEYTVTINWGMSGMSKAPVLAEQHCQQYGKHAQFAGKQDFFIFYNCVKA